MTDITEMRNRPGKARWWPLVPETPWRAVLGYNEMTPLFQPVQRGPCAARREVSEVCSVKSAGAVARWPQPWGRGSEGGCQPGPAPYLPRQGPGAAA